MGCNCGGNRRRAARAGGGVVGTQVYSVTLPGETTSTEYLTPLEAKRAIRRAGGGTLKVVTQPPAATA